jgi:hypothetical protein
VDPQTRLQSLTRLDPWRGSSDGKEIAMTGKALVRALIFALLMGTCGIGIASTQTNVPDPAAYAEAKRLATETFLDAGNPTEERLQAARKLGYPEAETFVELLRVGTDPNDDPQVRLEALKRYRYDDRYINAVLTIIADTSENEDLAAGLIEDISRRTTFRQPAQIRQELQDALRRRLDDPRDAVRLAAYRVLVSMEDAMAVSQLVEALRAGGDVPIRLPDALELLDVDGPAKHIVTLRPYLEHPDPAVQAQAARALAVDPQSRAEIVSLAVSSETPTLVRTNALHALAREDEDFLDYAIGLMTDRQEEPDIRQAAMKASMSRLNYQGVSAETQIAFAQAIETVASERGILTLEGQDVGAQARDLMPYLRKAFPAVSRHFEQR